MYRLYRDDVEPVARQMLRVRISVPHVAPTLSLVKLAHRVARHNVIPAHGSAIDVGNR